MKTAAVRFSLVLIMTLFFYGCDHELTQEERVDRIFSLPMHPFMVSEEQDLVIATLLKAV